MKLRYILACFLLMTVGVFAAMPPMPIPLAGKVISEGVNSGLNVLIKNSATGEEMTTVTNENGEFIIDLANAQLTVRDGDTIDVTILGKTLQNKIVNGMPQFTKLVFSFVDSCPPYPSCEAPACPTCAAGLTQCPSCSCGGCPDVICPTYNCAASPDCICPNGQYPVCPTCPETPVCPVDNKTDVLIASLIMAVIGSSVAILAMRKKFEAYLKILEGMSPGEGMLVSISKSIDGKVNSQPTQHKHLGHTSYHSINTVHEKYWHPKGVIDPDYDTNGNFVAKGG